MTKKKIRKSIRIDGKLVQAPFTNAENARAWYSQMHSKKVFGDFNLQVPKANSGILVKDFAEGEFMAGRRANYPESTWRADEQRLRDHILPAIGTIQLAKVKTTHVRALLSALTEKKKLSPKTRDRVQALISVIYTEAINRPGGPLVDTNPCFGVTFRRGKRIGTKPPSYLHTHKEVIEYLKAAKKLSSLHYGVASLGIMAGLRKQEQIALRNRHVDYVAMVIEVSEKYVQATKEIVPGTKAGEECVRFVPMSNALVSALKEVHQAAKLKNSDDFVLQNADGSHLSPKQVYVLNDAIGARCGFKVSVHGLRHTFGREFAERSGNMGALQDILGHSNSATTRLYSSLGKDRLKGFRGVMDYDI